MTPELERELKVLRLRGNFDPKRLDVVVDGDAIFCTSVRCIQIGLSKWWKPLGVGTVSR